MSKVTSIRTGASAKIPTQGGDRFTLPNQSVGTSELQPLSVTQDILANDANSFPWIKDGFQNFVGRDFLTPINGAPSAGQFRTFGIVNRTSVPDLSNDLSVNMGVQRLIFDSVNELSNEIGPSGEKVYSVSNDLDNRLRFVGNWTYLANGGDGVTLQNQIAGSFFEIVFYGTGLNILTTDAAGAGLRVTVDGGAEGGAIIGSQSSVLNNRFYTMNTVVHAVKDLSLGLHTIKVRDSTGFASICGVEIINQSTSLSIAPGSAYINGVETPETTASLTAYNSGFTNVLGTPGSRGGRVLVYKDSSGVKKDIQYTDSASAFLSSASHSNEEVSRDYNFREFGSGTTNDFSTITPSTTTRAYPLDDGTTNLLAQNAFINTNVSGQEGLSFQSSGDYCTLTFAGTGLDIVALVQSAGSNPDMVITVNGTNVGTLNAASFPLASPLPQNIKIASGLPYGTHVVKIARGPSGATNIILQRFKIYAPKKPALPVSSIELAEYNIMATYVANTVGSSLNIASGTLRKHNSREMNYIGTGWDGNYALDVANMASGFQVYATGGLTTNYVEYHFFGTGFEWRFGNDNGQSPTFVISVNGVTNLSGAGYTTSLYQGTSGLTFTASTGTVGGTVSGGSAYAQGVQVSGIPLGFHTVRVTRASTGATMYHNSFDVITPIHISSNQSGDINATLSIGNNSLSNSRNLTPLKGIQIQPASWAYAKGSLANPSTTSTSPVAMPDMVAIIKGTGKPVYFEFDGTFLVNSAGQNVDMFMYLNGSLIEYRSFTQPSVNYRVTPTIGHLRTLGIGYHLIQIFWNTSGGTLSGYDVHRSLKIFEIT